VSSWQRRFLIILFSSFFFEIFIFSFWLVVPFLILVARKDNGGAMRRTLLTSSACLPHPGQKAYLLAAWLLGIYIQRLTASLGFPAPYLPTYSPHSLPNPPHSSSSFDSHAHPFKTSVRRFAFVIRYLRGFPI